MPRKHTAEDIHPPISHKLPLVPLCEMIKHAAPAAVAEHAFCVHLSTRQDVHIPLHRRTFGRE